MKKIVVHSLMCLSLVVGSDVHALDFDDFKQPVVAVAAVVVGCVGWSLGYLVRGRNYKAECIKEERELLQDKIVQEKQQKREDAQRLLIEMQKKYAAELEIAFALPRRDLNQEEYNARLMQFNHVTPYVHVTYARELQKDIGQLRVHLNDFPQDDKVLAERLERSLQIIFEKHNVVFKNALTKELQDEKVALAEQQKRDYQIGIEKEKYKAAKFDAERLEAAKNAICDIRNKALSELESANRNAQNNQNKMADYAAAMHANNLASHSMILQDIRSEITSNGLRNLANAVNNLREEVAQLRREGSLSFKEAQRIHIRIDELKVGIEQARNAALQAKNDGALQKKELDKISKIIDRMDDSLAVISSDVGDIKSGNMHGELSAPPRPY